MPLCEGVCTLDAHQEKVCRSKDLSMFTARLQFEMATLHPLIELMPSVLLDRRSEIRPSKFASDAPSQLNNDHRKLPGTPSGEYFSENNWSRNVETKLRCFLYFSCFSSSSVWAVMAAPSDMMFTRSVLLYAAKRPTKVVSALGTTRTLTRSPHEPVSRKTLTEAASLVSNHNSELCEFQFP